MDKVYVICKLSPNPSAQLDKITLVGRQIIFLTNYSAMFLANEINNNVCGLLINLFHT